MPAPDAFNVWSAITPSDTVDLPALTDAVWVGGAGAVAAVMQNGQVSVIAAAPAGALLPIRVRRINATGTTATALISLRQV